MVVSCPAIMTLNESPTKITSMPLFLSALAKQAS